MCRPSALTRPPSRTRIRSASRTVERRWAITKVVRPSRIRRSAPSTASTDGDRDAVRRAIASCRRDASRVQAAGLDASVPARTAEGFAHYSLYPEQYVVAAGRFVSTTVRPHGHPFDRRLMLSERLRQRLRRTRASHFAIVDEGPGLSGSSFAATSDALLELGISPSRIVLFPSWPAPATALNSARGRRTWERHRHFVSAFDAVFATGGHENLSGCAWRR